MRILKNRLKHQGEFLKYRTGTVEEANFVGGSNFGTKKVFVCEFLLTHLSSWSEKKKKLHNKYRYVPVILNVVKNYI